MQTLWGSLTSRRILTRECTANCLLFLCLGETDTFLLGLAAGCVGELRPDRRVQVTTVGSMLLGVFRARSCAASQGLVRVSVVLPHVVLPYKTCDEVTVTVQE